MKCSLGETHSTTRNGVESRAKGKGVEILKQIIVKSGGRKNTRALG